MRLLHCRTCTTFTARRPAYSPTAESGRRGAGSLFAGVEVFRQIRAGHELSRVAFQDPVSHAPPLPTKVVQYADVKENEEFIEPIATYSPRVPEHITNEEILAAPRGKYPGSPGPANECFGTRHGFCPRCLRFSGIFVLGGGSGRWSFAARLFD